MTALGPTPLHLRPARNRPSGGTERRPGFMSQPGGISRSTGGGATPAPQRSHEMHVLHVIHVKQVIDVMQVIHVMHAIHLMQVIHVMLVIHVPPRDGDGPGGAPHGKKLPSVEKGACQQQTSVFSSPCPLTIHPPIGIHLGSSMAPTPRLEPFETDFLLTSSPCAGFVSSHSHYKSPVCLTDNFSG